MTAPSMHSITTRFNSPPLRLLLRAIYYLGILGALLLVSELVGFAPAGFIYQGF